MKKYPVAIIMFIVITSFVIQQGGNDKVFKQLHALEGKWIMKTKKGFIGEEWIKINDDYLQGKGFFVKGTDTVITERVTLRKTAEGIFYTSTVEDQNNKQPVSFSLTAAGDHIFVFENPVHDFPKRITYDLVSADSLHAYIDGGADAAGNRQDFYYHKVKYR